jgi:hypothetical protein
MVTVLPPLRTTRKVRCPRSVAKSSTLAPKASEIRSPSNASSKINA